MLGIALSFIGGLFKGPLSRVLDTVDKKTEAGMNQDKLKADIIQTHYQTRAGFMAAGGFVLMLLFAVPLAAHSAAVALYSMIWCAKCVWPYAGLDYQWSIAALPPPIGPIYASDGSVYSDGYQGLIIMSIFGVVGVTRFARR